MIEISCFHLGNKFLKTEKQCLLQKENLLLFLFLIFFVSDFGNFADLLLFFETVLQRFFICIHCEIVV